LDTGDPLTPSHIFGQGWETEALCRAYNADGSYKTLDTPPVFMGVPALPETTADGDNAPSSNTDTDAQVEEQLLYSVMGLEILYDESGREVLIITAKEEFNPQYSYITISVPASYINWN
nr:hypothetical protein [Clostridia bacterium]